MTDQEYRECILAELKRMNESLAEIKDYQKTLIVYFETVAASPEFEAIKTSCAQSLKDTSTMLKVAQRRWST